MRKAHKSRTLDNCHLKCPPTVHCCELHVRITSPLDNPIITRPANVVCQDQQGKVYHHCLQAIGFNSSILLAKHNMRQLNLRIATKIPMRKPKTPITMTTRNTTQSKSLSSTRFPLTRILENMSRKVMSGFTSSTRSS